MCNTYTLSGVYFVELYILWHWKTPNEQITQKHRKIKGYQPNVEQKTYPVYVICFLNVLYLHYLGFVLCSCYIYIFLYVHLDVTLENTKRTDNTEKVKGNKSIDEQLTYTVCVICSLYMLYFHYLWLVLCNCVHMHKRTLWNNVRKHNKKKIHNTYSWFTFAFRIFFSSRTRTPFQNR